MEPVVNAYLSGSEIVVLRRDGEGRIHRSSARPEHVAYVSADRVDPDFERQLSGSRHVRSLKREGSWVRVGFSDRFVREDMVFGKRGSEPRPSPFEQRGIKVYEGDVNPVRRWMTDNSVKVQRPRRCFLDIETDSRVPFSRKEEMRVLCWCVVDPTGTSWTGVLEEDSDRDERRLLEELFVLIMAYDQVLAWNGDGFDFPVIKARAERVGAQPAGKLLVPDRWLWLDQLALFKKMNQHAAESGDEKQSMKLDAIATVLLGEGKDPFDASKTWQAWEAGGDRRAEMVRYCAKDTDLLRRIEEKTKFAALQDVVCEFCGIFPDSRSLQATQVMDGYMLRLGLENGVHFPTKRHYQGTEKYLGAYVMEPRASGIERDVDVFDFSGMYPSIMLTWNMSPETKALVPVNGPVPPGFCRSPSTGQGFRVDRPGLVTIALKELMAERKRLKAVKASLTPGTPGWVDAGRLSDALKIVINSFYGVLGSPFSRFFDPRIAEAVTQNGKWLMLRVKHEAEQRGMRVLYIDTDGIYVQGCSRTEARRFVAWCNAELFPKIVAEQGCVENHVEIAYEKRFSRIVFVSAKRYAAMFDSYGDEAATADSRPEVKGLEYKRGDASKLARDLQEKVIMRIVKDGVEDPAECRAMVKELLDRVLNKPLPVELVQVSKAVTKPLREYVAKKKGDGEDAALPAHVRVAKMLEQRGEDVGEGTRISYVVLDGDGGLNALAPASDYEGECDRYYLWESLVYPPTQRFLQAAFPDHDWSTDLESVRPPKPRGGRKKVLAGQLGFDVGGDGQPEFVVEVDERLASVLTKLAELASRHPGARPMRIHLRLASGAVAVLDSRKTVSGSSQLVAEVEKLVWEEIALVDWAERCS